MKFLEELKRRNVLRVGSAYVVGAWLLAQVAEFITETFAAPLWILQSIVVLFSVALVPVLVFTWMFEFTPAGFRRQDELDRAGVVVSRAGRRLDYLVAGLLLVAAGWIAFSWSERMRGADEAAATVALAAQQAEAERRAKASESTAPANSIAVLPFLNLSTAADSGVLADGLAEELLGVLGRNRGLRVTARSSAFRFKDQSRDLREVGKLLGVRYVLEGSVRLVASRIRIGTQLIDASSGVQVWSGTYDRTLDDLFALQDEIAGEVARALNAMLVAGETPATRGTFSTEAHLALMRALQLADSRLVTDLDQAIAQLQQAIALDPDYAAAYVELAYAISTRALQLEDAVSARPVIGPLLDKALQLDPRNGPALILRGLLLDDPVEEEKAIRAGLALAPSHARGYEMLAGHVSKDPARHAEALALIDQAIALDPLSPRNHQMKGILVLHGPGSSSVAQAEPHFRRVLELEPRFRNALPHMANAMMLNGEFGAAVDYTERMLELAPDDPVMRARLVVACLNLGDADCARAANRPATTAGDILILMYTGDTDGAMARLRALPEREQATVGHQFVIVLALRHAHAHGTWAEDLALATRGWDGAVSDEPVPQSIGYTVWPVMMRGAGRIDDAERINAAAAARLLRLEAGGVDWLQRPFQLQHALLHAQAGRNDEALDALEKAFQPAPPWWWAILDHNPIFEPLVGHPRFKALRARLDSHLTAQRERLDELRRVRADTPGAPEGSRGHHGG